MPKVEVAPNKTGDYLVDYEEKVFEDVKASPGEKALVTFHTVAFEGSIGLVNLLQAIRLQRKGFMLSCGWLSRKTSHEQTPHEPTTFQLRRATARFDCFRFSKRRLRCAGRCTIRATI